MQRNASKAFCSINVSGSVCVTVCGCQQVVCGKSALPQTFFSFQKSKLIFLRHKSQQIHRPEIKSCQSSLEPVEGQTSISKCL
jgi:hypothetical protein